MIRPGQLRLAILILSSLLLILSVKPGRAWGWFKDIKWGMTPQGLVQKIPQVSLYSKPQKSGLANVYMFAGSKSQVEDKLVTIEYGGIGPNSNLEIIMAFIHDPTEIDYFKYKETLTSGYGKPARSTETPGSFKRQVNPGMLTSEWDIFERNITLKLVYNGKAIPPRLNMIFSTIKAANKILEYYSPKR